jgi:L-lactate dehydrogenase complex protein LldG
MSSAREDILSRVRAAAADAPSVEVPREYRQAGAPAGSPGLVDRFAERVADYRADVHRCSPEEVGATVTTILSGRSLRRIVVPAGFSAEGIEDFDVISGDTATVADLDASTCAAAIAETGTVVLDAGAGQGRRALSLVPDYLLVVVRAEQIVELVGEALAILDPFRPLTWISGPSATSDIELQRVEGVHGPRTLDVVIVEPR